MVINQINPLVYNDNKGLNAMQCSIVLFYK